MKELNSSEINSVSGAGAFTDAGAALGGGIGAIVDASIGQGSTGTNAGAALGGGIGAIIDASLGIISGLFGGLLGKK